MSKPADFNDRRDQYINEVRAGLKRQAIAMLQWLEKRQLDPTAPPLLEMDMLMLTSHLAVLGALQVLLDDMVERGRIKLVKAGMH